MQAYDDDKNNISESAKAKIGESCESVVDILMRKLGQGKIKESLRRIGNF